MHDAVQFADKNGVIFVASRGNYPQVTPIDAPNFPATFQDEMVINVGASGTDGNWKTSGNGNPNDAGDNDYSSMTKRGVDIIAPGTNAIVFTTETGTNDWRGFNGTSAACPHVSGVAGLMLSYFNQPFPHYSNLTIEDVENILQFSAVDKNAAGYDDYAGWGLLDATAAMNKIKSPAYKIQHFGVGTNVTSYSIIPFVMAKDVKVILPTSYGTLASGTYFADRVQITIILNYNLNSPNDQILAFWPRFSSTLGWSGANPINAENWCYIVSATNTQAILRTFVYNFKYAATGSTIIDPWYPADQFNAKAALSIYTFNPTLLSVDEKGKDAISLSAFPNPANNNVTINISMPSAQEISLELYNSQGKFIKQIAREKVASGKHKYMFSTTDMAEGVYYYRLNSKETNTGKKLIIIK